MAATHLHDSESDTHASHNKPTEVNEAGQKPPKAANQQITIGKKTFVKGDIFKFVGLLAFFLIMMLICASFWPYVADIFEPGGLDRIIEDVRNAGPVGVFLLLGMQFLQIVVAFIPGEVTQVAAGILYGPWLGALIILTGCVVSSAFIFGLVHKLGAPFVQSVVPTKYLEKFRAFEKTGKLNFIVFILFLIPGLPKDTFTYLVPLTDMRMRTFLILSNLGRIPGVLVSTYAADGFMDGRIVESAIIFGIAAVIGTLGLVFREKIMEIADKVTKKDHKEPAGKATEKNVGKVAKEAVGKAAREVNGEAAGGVTKEVHGEPAGKLTEEDADGVTKKATGKVTREDRN